MQGLVTRKCVSVLLIAAFSYVLVGCANRQYATPDEAIQNACSAFGPKALSGALIGGAVGAAGGAAIGAGVGGGRNAALGALAGLAAGVIAGAIVGNITDKRDCQEAQLALQQMATASTGTRVAWNSVSGSYGAFTPMSDATTANGRTCREVRSDYYIKNHQPVVGEPGLVCRSANGDWGRVDPTTQGPS